jgi:ribose 1,5-bisphosphokinase
MARSSGALVLVVGGSGVGKDTILNGARATLAGDARIVFPRRTITRAPDATEDHDAVTPDDFERLAAAGAFALSWAAHGLRYAIPGAIDAHLSAGRTVVCNVSRTIVAQARATYPRTVVVEITVPPEVRAARIAARGRESTADASARLARDVGRDLAADHVLDNSGSPDVAIGAFVALLRDLADR